MTDKSRRTLGFFVGLSMGFCYGGLSQLSNALLLPGVPLFQAEPGRWITLALITLAGGAMGLAAAWPGDTLPGVILSALAGAALSSFMAMRSVPVGTETAGQVYTLLFFTFLPRAVIFLPAAALVRWAINTWESEIQVVTFSVRKLALSLGGLLGLAIVVGLLSIYPAQARYALRTTNGLILAGFQTTSPDALPEALLPVDRFFELAEGPYTLQLSNEPDLLPVQRPMAAYGAEEYAVFVLFENGFRFGCAFTPPYPNPSCGEY
ncbi:MAG: hypothetical protein PHS96_10080 [Anaerolineales bacterium]|nr:hypothetical protein [Anaerolineales bacterium]